MTMPSENGWNPARVGQDAVQWVDIPGAPVRLQIMQGWPLQVLRAFAADYHAFVEPLRDVDSASWTPTNSVPTSNHLNGTAMDLNWNTHPFRVKGTFTAAQMRTIRELLEFYEGTVFWAGDWRDPIDEMHWQMGYGTYDNPDVGDFIKRKIRADGYSTFRRGGGSPAAPASQADLLAAATGLSRTAAEKVLPQVRDGLAASSCTTPRRIATWLAQIGHESDGFRATEEYANGDENTDRWRYKGRTWIQITWRTNYAGFSTWAHGRGLVPTATYFVDNPRALAEQKWAGLGAAWYWTVARPQINTLCDAGDFIGVTKAINGGTNGLADRQARYARALAQGDALLALTSTAPTPTPGGFLMALSDAEQREMLDLLRQQNAYRRVSRSPLRRVGERETETISGFAWNTDGSVHVLLVNLLARLGDPDALALLQEVAAVDPSRHPDRARDRLLAQAILNSLDGTTAVESAPPTGELPGAVELPPVYPAPVYAEAVFHQAPVVPYSVNEPEPSALLPGDGVRTATATLGTAIAEIRDMLNTYTEQLRS